MTETAKAIRADIERIVAHLARVHQVDQMAVWQEMYLRALEEITLKQ